MRQTILALVFMNAAIVHGEELPVSGSITLDQVIVAVLERNPQLGANDLEARAAAARIRQARLSTPLELTLELENVAGSGDYTGVDRLETTLSLAKVLEAGDKASLRGNLAREQAGLLTTKQDGQRLDLLAGVAEQFLHVAVDQHRLRITLERLELLERTHDIVAQRVAAGKSHVAERRRVAIDLERAGIEREHAEHELAASRVRLATYWGETQPSFGTVQAELFELPPVKSFAALEALLENNPDLIRFATEERVARARLRLAQAGGAPDLALSAGVRYLNDPDDAALVLSASMPLGARKRAAPAIEEMEFLAERDPLRYRRQYLTLYSSLYGIYQELRHAQTAFEALSRRIIPEAERMADDYERGYRSGRFSLLELNEAQRTLLDARLEAVTAAANYHRYRIEIERLTGAALQAPLQEKDTP